jgi:hypothetical protein
MARRGYPAEFWRRVVDLVEGGRKVSEVATELEVSEHDGDVALVDSELGGAAFRIRLPRRPG